MGWGSVGIRGYKMKIENFKTKLKECPKCGCKSIYVPYASINYDGTINLTHIILRCNNPKCNARFEFRGGWLVEVDAE